VQLLELCVCGHEWDLALLKPLLNFWKGVKARINMYHVPAMKLRDLLESFCLLYKQTTEPSSAIAEWLAL